MEDKDEERVTIKEYSRAKKGRKPLPDSLPRVEIIHDLTDEEKICPHDGHALKKIGEETSEQLSYIPAKIRVLRHVRLKYACPYCEEVEFDDGFLSRFKCDRCEVEFDKPKLVAEEDL